MVTFRPLSSDFQIDGKDMPIPNEYNTATQIISTDDSGRLAGNGAMQIDYLTHVYVTTWTYTFMTGDEYDLVYKAYIEGTITSRSMYHMLKTINSNTRKSLSYKIYTQDEMQGQLKKYMPDKVRYMGLSFPNGVALYHDVVFTFVGVGGEEYAGT